MMVRPSTLRVEPKNLVRKFRIFVFQLKLKVSIIKLTGFAAHGNVTSASATSLTDTRANFSPGGMSAVYPAEPLFVAIVEGSASREKRRGEGTVGRGEEKRIEMNVIKPVL
jgi:hypothetical protein